MKIPEKPREFIWLIIKIGLIGSSPALLIHFLSSHPIWDTIKPWFFTEAWQYLNWWATVYPEPAFAFLAIYIAFSVQNRARTKQFLKRVREIVPYIYIELVENSFLIREAKDGIRSFKNRKRIFRS